MQRCMPMISRWMNKSTSEKTIEVCARQFSLRTQLTIPSQPWQMDIAILVFQPHRRGDQARRGFQICVVEREGGKPPRQADQYSNTGHEHKRLAGSLFGTYICVHYQGQQRSPHAVHARSCYRTRDPNGSPSECGTKLATQPLFDSNHRGRYATREDSDTTQLNA
jgi:hypothetical protein